MKRKALTGVFLSIVLVLTLFMSALAAEPPIRIVVGGEPLETDVNPMIVEGRTMLPVRAVFEAIGANVSWDGDTRTVTAQKGDTTVTLQIDSKRMGINGEGKTLDVPAP